MRLSNTLLVYAAPVQVSPPLMPTYAPLAQAVLPQVQVLTLQTLPPGLNVSFFPSPGPPAPPIASASVLLRVRHIYAAGEEASSGAWNSTVTIDLATLLAPALNVTAATELTADAMRPLAAARSAQIQWAQLPGYGDSSFCGNAAAVASTFGAAPDAVKRSTQAIALPVTLRPMEIRTFLLQVA
jgi:hypothetical protein